VEKDVIAVSRFVTGGNLHVGLQSISSAGGQLPLGCTGCACDLLFSPGYMFGVHRGCHVH
jgi:hypothetical protein